MIMLIAYWGFTGRFFRNVGNWRHRDFLEPSAAYARFLLPPSELLDMPETGFCSR